MKIFTLTCPNCGTIVAANELENNRVMKCPGLECQNILEFADLSDPEREFFLDHLEGYQL